MGHRTLVAYDRDGYDLHYAHWGADPDSLTPETPFGGPPNDGWAHGPADELRTAEGGWITESHETAVEGDPIATDLSFVEIGEHIDPIEHEALFVVDGDFSVRPYVVFGLDSRVGRTDEPTIAAVGYSDESDAAYLRGWLAGARAVRGVCGPEDGAIVQALRWLDPARGTVVWMSGGGTKKEDTETG